MIEKLLYLIKTNWGISLVIAALIILNFVTRSDNIFCYDVFGYYLYLPKFFTDWNLHFTNLDWVNKINDTYHNSPTLYQFSFIDNEHYIIRYSIGMAILNLPFYLIAALLAFAFHFPVDGFSMPFQWSILIESISATCLGFIFLQKVLRNYFSNIWVQFALVCIFFGTNMTVHAGMYSLNVMSHNYLFMMYAILIYLSDAYYKTQQLKYWYLAIFCSAMMALVRPVEIISLLIPLLWGSFSWDSIRDRAREFLTIEKRRALFSILILFGIGSIQFIYWKVETGHFLINSYNNPGEGLDLLSPYLMDYLFSFRKGWILYTPLVGICIIGFWSIYKFQKQLFYAVLFLFLTSLYLTASWSIWWYSASYSSRAAIPAYSYLCFPLAALIQAVFRPNSSNSHLKYFTGIILLLVVLLNLFQTYQFHKGIIDPERMTKAAYLKNFLSLKKHPDTESLLIKSRSETGIEVFDSSTHYERRIIGLEDMEFGKDPSFVTQPVYEGKYAQRVPPSGFSKDLRVPFNATTTHDYAFLKISAYVFIPETADSITKVNLCAEMQHNGKVYFWRSLNFEKLHLSRNQWQYVEFIYLTPEVRSREDLFKTYFWNRGGDEIYVDKMMLETFY